MGRQGLRWGSAVSHPDPSPRDRKVQGQQDPGMTPFCLIGFASVRMLRKSGCRQSPWRWWWTRHPAESSSWPSPSFRDRETRFSRNFLIPRPQPTPPTGVQALLRAPSSQDYGAGDKVSEETSGEPRKALLPQCLPYHYECHLQMFIVRLEGGGMGQGCGKKLASIDTSCVKHCATSLRSMSPFDLTTSLRRKVLISPLYR